MAAPGTSLRTLQELKQLNSDRILVITEWPPELALQGPMATEGRLRKRTAIHFPPAVDNQLLGPLCLVCSRIHTEHGCRHRIWLQTDHTDRDNGSRPRLEPTDTDIIAQLEEEALRLQARVGLSSIVIEEQLFTRHQVRRALRREQQAAGEGSDEAVEALVTEYEEMTFLLRRALFLQD